MGRPSPALSLLVMLLLIAQPLSSSLSLTSSLVRLPRPCSVGGAQRGDRRPIHPASPSPLLPGALLPPLTCLSWSRARLSPLTLRFRPSTQTAGLDTTGFSSHNCNRCEVTIPAAYRCPACDFDLCLQCCSTTMALGTGMAGVCVCVCRGRAWQSVADMSPYGEYRVFDFLIFDLPPRAYSHAQT